MSNSTDLISAAEAARVIGITPVALYARRKRGVAPAWTNLAAPGNTRPVVRYSLTDILAFKADRLAALSTMAEPVTPPEPVAEPVAKHDATLAATVGDLKRRLEVIEVAVVLLGGQANG